MDSPWDARLTFEREPLVIVVPQFVIRNSQRESAEREPLHFGLVKTGRWAGGQVNPALREPTQRRRKGAS